jgi:hypothetical protein
MDGTGTCSSNEKGLIKTEHNTRAIAETRAKNRAIADLCAFGETTAEEIIDDNAPDPTDNWKSQYDKPQTENSTCEGCGIKNLSEKVVKFSQENYGRVLCYRCQRKEPADIEGSETQR